MQTDVLACRIPASEAAQVRHLARRHGTTVSDELRRALRALTAHEHGSDDATSAGLRGR